MLFKQGIEPMWEDVQNREGGRWLLTTVSHSLIFPNLIISIGQEKARSGLGPNLVRDSSLLDRRSIRWCQWGCKTVLKLARPNLKSIRSAELASKFARKRTKWRSGPPTRTTKIETCRSAENSRRESSSPQNRFSTKNIQTQPILPANKARTSQVSSQFTIRFIIVFTRIRIHHLIRQIWATNESCNSFPAMAKERACSSFKLFTFIDFSLGSIGNFPMFAA